jgi:hypothetical protein
MVDLRECDGSFALSFVEDEVKRIAQFARYTEHPKETALALLSAIQSNLEQYFPENDDPPRDPKIVAAFDLLRRYPPAPEDFEAKVMARLRKIMPRLREDQEQE